MRCGRHVRFVSPVVRSITRTARLRDATTSVLLSGLTAKHVIGSESCKMQHKE